MSLLNRIIQRVTRDYLRAKYHRVVRQVLATPPLRPGSLPFMLLSMVQQRDVHSYLVAVKSFSHFLNPERVVVICDQSITLADRAILKQHVPHIELRNADEFTHPDLPRGGTWERLFAIAQFSPASYIVQLDADTLTVRPIPEVLEAIQAEHGFVLGEMADTPIRSLAEARAYSLPYLGPGAHIQNISEVAIAEVGLPAQARYIRGCSGFTGFPRSDAMRERMLDFSRRMGGKLGEDWKRWGTEQVTSNYLIANSPGIRPLPFPKYGTPDCATADTAFFHFIGSMRFINDKYEATSRHAIALIGSVAVREPSVTAL